MLAGLKNKQYNMTAFIKDMLPYQSFIYPIESTSNGFVKDVYNGVVADEGDIGGDDDKDELKINRYNQNEMIKYQHMGSIGVQSITSTTGLLKVLHYKQINTNNTKNNAKKQNCLKLSIPKMLLPKHLSVYYNNPSLITIDTIIYITKRMIDLIFPLHDLSLLPRLQKNCVKNRNKKYTFFFFF
jgi:hypothetical protein